VPDQRPTSSDALAGIVILVVDDNQDTVGLLVVALSMYGAVVAGASSVAEALAKLESIDPHLIITDINMPVEDGYALLGRVRSLTPECDACVPVVAFTAMADPDERRRSETAGFEGFLTKPTDPSALVRAVIDLVRRR
jgi:CheY-like chemotaxis protein